MTHELSLGMMKHLAGLDRGTSRVLIPAGIQSWNFHIYPRSIREFDQKIFCIFRNEEDERRLGVVSSFSETDKELEILRTIPLPDGSFLHEGSLSCGNAGALRERFPFCRPMLTGKERSFGFGDRLGLANPGHVQALQDSGVSFFPVLAQQSVRELDRSGRTAQEVLDVATYSAMQENWTSGFGADADHLKTETDLDRYLEAGFRMMTLDPGEEVDNEADHLGEEDLRLRADSLPWSRLNDTLPALLSRYRDSRWSADLSASDILRAAVKYGRVLARIHKLYRHLEGRVDRTDIEVELSIDETDSVTSPFEHLFLLQELGRRGIEIDSLAPRFVGNLEKGIDYRGNLEEFRSHFARHLEISEEMGGYKLSLHSGSDKFSLYSVVASAGSRLHVKTAGTSYLEAVRTIAQVETEFFLQIWEYSKAIYPRARASYHVSAEVEDLPLIDSQTSVAQLLELIDEHDPLRQVLHVAFGDVLSEKGSRGEFRFRSRLLDCIDRNEEVHLANLNRHFQRHLKSFDPAF